MPGAEKDTFTYNAGGGSTGTVTDIDNGTVVNRQVNVSGGEIDGRGHSNTANTDGAYHSVQQSSTDVGEGYGDYELDMVFVQSGNENQQHYVTRYSEESADRDYDHIQTINDQGMNTVIMTDDAHPFHVNTIGEGFDLV